MSDSSDGIYPAVLLFAVLPQHMHGGVMTSLCFIMPTNSSRSFRKTLQVASAAIAHYRDVDDLACCIEIMQLPGKLLSIAETALV
jgi:hypothetical protein